MKKVALLFIVAMLLVMSSVVAYAAQPAEAALSDKEEIIQIADSRVFADGKDVIVVRSYRPGQTVPNSIMYNSGGYTGILYYVSGYFDGQYFQATFSGWVYTGGVQPWSVL